MKFIENRKEILIMKKNIVKEYQYNFHLFKKYSHDYNQKRVRSF